MEGSKLVSVGGSKLVPNVQELAKQTIDKIPPRYVRSDLDAPTIFSNPALSPTLPVIDLDKLLSAVNMDSELDRLNSACKDWGFFQLVNHGVDTRLVEKAKREIQEFFELPIEQKRKFWQREDNIEGFGQIFVLSDEQKLDWGDMFFMYTLPINARKPHLFPKLPLPFRDTIDAYSLEMKLLTMKILGMIEKALKMDANEITELFEDGVQSMRMNYYPPCPQPEQVIGLAPHSDADGLTILLQINEMEGLQIRKDGMWIPIKSLPNAFIVNIGDILEIVTNGIYRSIEHRATVNKQKERLSIATFYSPRFDREIGPAHSLVTEKSPELFRRVIMEDYLKGFVTRKLVGKSYLDVMRIDN
ncbi:Srg1 [Thalictrum thalictroides]|uniref:Srg1 n=1 Tax=Thalictrum thalictroides TaxID=46969 RepID=A0A7J6VHL7_THATH|nr:Srg1 [Thalictrum thalictroides]